MSTYRIVAYGTVSESWAIERNADSEQEAEPLFLFDSQTEAQTALACILARQALRES